jgi:cytochrome c-type biogenesis protein CcmH
MAFWSIVVAMMLAALACVTTPLLRRDPMLTARHAALAGLLVALLPSFALMLYMRIGEPAAPAIERAAMSGDDDAKGEMPASLEAAVSKLAWRLRRDPADTQSWKMLARSYVILERPADAALAYRRALKARPDDADMLADYADALASANGGDLNGAARTSIEEALTIAPDHPKALALAASAALDRGDKAQAIRYWTRLKDVPGVDPTIARQAQKNIDDTRAFEAMRAH